MNLTIIYMYFKICLPGTSLVVQWLRLHAPHVKGIGSIPGQGTKIPHTTQCSQKQTNKKLQKYGVFYPIL